MHLVLFVDFLFCSISGAGRGGNAEDNSHCFKNFACINSFKPHTNSMIHTTLKPNDKVGQNPEMLNNFPQDPNSQ